MIYDWTATRQDKSNCNFNFTSDFSLAKQLLLQIRSSVSKTRTSIQLRNHSVLTKSGLKS